MHSFINYGKLTSLYVYFVMLHTTLHNETNIIRQRYQGHHISHLPSIRNDPEENSHLESTVKSPLDNEETEIKIFDMVVPKFDEDILLWPKTGNYVVIQYALDPSLNQDQQRAISGVLRSIEKHTCIRFTALASPVSGGGGTEKLCFRSGSERAAPLGRRPTGLQTVTLAPGDGPYWVLHLVGHVLGLPHPHTCLHGLVSGQELSRNATRTGCILRRCPWRRFDPGSALHLTPEELGGWLPPHPYPAATLLALWRTRRVARLSHWDRLALHDLYRCSEGCPTRRCRHGGFVDTRCRCVCSPGFGGEDCGLKTGQGGDGDGDEPCVKHLAVKTRLELTLSGLAESGTRATDQCILRVRTASQRLRILVTVAGAEEDLSTVSRERKTMVYSEALLCTFRIFVFRSGSPGRTYCMLDYLGESLQLNAIGNIVDLLFSSGPLLRNARQVWKSTRLVIRSVEDLSNNTTTNLTTATKTPVTTPIATSPPATVTSAAPDNMRSAVGVEHPVHLIVLTPVLFALMGFNILVVFCIRKYWEYRYGTAGIYRGTEGDYWHDQDEEEPEEWQIKVEYSDSFQETSPLGREMDRDVSLPQEMTDMELFRRMYGVSGERQESEGALTVNGTSSKSKKRVSFSDENGKPLHSDEPLEKRTGRTTQSTGKAGRSQLKRGTSEVRIVMPSSNVAQPAPSADNGNDSDSDEDSDQSSSCETSSSSSSHEDEDDPKTAEPRLLHGLTRCFRRKQENESNEIQ